MRRRCSGGRLPGGVATREGEDAVEQRRVLGHGDPGAEQAGDLAVVYVDAWLDTEITSAKEVLDILAGSAGVTLDAYPVSRMVNKPSIDGRELIQPMA